MKYKSAMMTQASGSVGGMTASRNRGGNYMRSRAIPTNPNTPQQAAVRSIMAQLSAAWLSTLSIVNRQSWETYAANVPLINSLGDPITVSGLNMFIRANVPNLQAGGSLLTFASTEFNLGVFTPTVVGTIVPNTTFEIEYTNTDDWARTDGGMLLVRSGISVNPTINYFTGPYRQAGVVLGDALTPPTSPVVVTPVYPMSADAKIFVEVRGLTGDGRLSAKQQLSFINA